MKNRFMLAPLTNTQSHENGQLSDDEFNWLTMRAKGGFGLTMTYASHVQAIGQGFPGQLGIFSDDHIPLGVRLSPERFGMDIAEVKSICQRLINENIIDFLDLSLWDCFKQPADEAYQEKTLLGHFAELDFKNVKWTVAGKIRSGNDVRAILETGVDYVTIGRSAILHHDFPTQVMTNAAFTPIETPVSEAYLHDQGLGAKFVEYMKR